MQFDKPQQAAQEFLRSGWTPIPVPYREKGPVLKRWQALRMTENDVSRYFNGRPQNVGVLLGDPSGNLIDIDLDCDEAVRLASRFLPRTLIFGRDSRPRSHWLYQAQSLRTEKFIAPAEEGKAAQVLVEIRSNGCQTIFPPSTHPSGELVKFSVDFSETEIRDAVIQTNAADLRQSVARLAAASLLVRHGWSEDAASAAIEDTTLLAEVEGSVGEQVRRWCAGNDQKSTQNSGANFDAAALAYNSDHPSNWSESHGTCPACGHHDCFGHLDGNADRWVCHSASHTKPGLPGKACYHGDALDLDAHAAGLTRAALLRREGYLSPPEHHSATTEETQWPALGALPTAAPAPKLPEEMLPEPLRPWLVELAEHACFPLEYVAAPALVALSAVVGRSLGIRPWPRSDYLVVPNLWGAIIGRPGTMKTNAISSALKPLKRLAKVARDHHQEQESGQRARRERIEQEIAALKGDMKNRKANLDHLELELVEKIDELNQSQTMERRYLTQDATVEKLGDILKDNPRGLLVSRDELAGWLRSFAKSGREGDREFYLEGWNGTGIFTYDRMGRGTVHIPAITLSIIGGIQPNKLRPYIKDAVNGGAHDDGLLQRLQLAVWPDDPPPWSLPDRELDTKAQNEAFRIYDWADSRLPTIDFGKKSNEDEIPFLRFSTEAEEIACHWRNELEARLRSDQLKSTPAFESHLSKYRSLMPSLALLFEVIKMAANGQHNDAVRFEAAQKAAAWCEYLEKHAQKIYNADAEPKVAPAQALAKKIRAGEVKGGDSVRDLYRRQLSGLRTSKDAHLAIEALTEAGWLRVEKTTPAGGRPSEIIQLHPELRRDT